MYHSSYLFVCNNDLLIMGDWVLIVNRKAAATVSQNNYPLISAANQKTVTHFSKHFRKNKSNILFTFEFNMLKYSLQFMVLRCGSEPKLLRAICVQVL